jgi:hypothetical protein
MQGDHALMSVWTSQRRADDREVLRQAKVFAESGVVVTDAEFLARVVREEMIA